MITISLFGCSLVPDDPNGGEEEEDAAETEERHGQIETLLDGEIVNHVSTVVAVRFLQLKTESHFGWFRARLTLPVSSWSPRGDRPGRGLRPPPGRESS